MTEIPVATSFDPETGIASIRFNRPEVLNAIDVPTARAFREAVREVTGRDGVRCIVLSGAGRAFVAGGDVSTFAADFDRAGNVLHELLDALHPAILALREASAPMIAAVQGVAAGAGFSLVLGADLVIAEEGARFMIAYDQVGAAPDCGGTWFLARKVGRARAAELMLLGQALSAGEARNIGIVNRVVPAAELETAANEVARKVGGGPTTAYGRFRRLVDDAHHNTLTEQLEEERKAFIEATGTLDFREGVSAFLEKRKPSFSGK